MHAFSSLMCTRARYDLWTPVNSMVPFHRGAKEDKFNMPEEGIWIWGQSLDTEPNDPASHQAYAQTIK